MIFESITLRDFGVYRGEQTVDLSTPSRDQPIILFGGLNGGGKTTMLSALQLALYGRRSNVWQAERSYDQYLARSIHRDADPAEGAGIELKFRISQGGNEQHIHVLRYWRNTGSKVVEDLEVIRDQILDTVLSEHWDDWIEGVMPARIAPLFFFDGERIEQLADPDRSSEILGTAVHALLGLDLVEQLRADLLVLERRKRSELPDSAELAELETVDREIERVESHRRELTSNKASVTTSLDQIARKMRDVQARLLSAGGDLFEARSELEDSRSTQSAQIDSLEQSLREAAAKSLPLQMIRPLLERLDVAAHSARDQAVAHEVRSILAERDERLMQAIRAAGAGPEQVQALEDFLRNDAKLRQQGLPQEEPGLGFDHGLGLRTHALLEHVLPRDTSQTNALLKDLGEAQSRLDTTDTRLAGIPDQDTIQPLLDERDRLTDEKAELDRVMERLEEEWALQNRKLDDLTRRRDRVAAKHAAELIERDDLQRILTHSQRSRSTLAQFKKAVLRQHVERIESLVLESFTGLMRKQMLVQNLKIDPETFRIELLTATGQTISAHDLSAGERQLLATSLLWGLSRASGRPWPTVIDTPLGRLDSKHRSKLVERYFPFASHQVMLLSTDEEIHAGYLPMLKKHVGRSYLLEFDDKSQTTSVCAGYFFGDES